MKKMFKSLLAILIVFSVAVSSVMAYNPYISDEIVKISSVKFTDMMTMEELTTVGYGQMIEVSVNVKAGTGIPAGQQVTLIVTVCNGAEVLECAESTMPEITDTTTTLSTMVMTPEDAETYKELSVRAYVWDNIDNGRPLASAALVRSDNVEINDIVIDGISLEGFSPDVKEYDYEVSAAHINFPEIVVVTENSAAKAEISINGNLYEDGASATITVKSADGTATDSYTINYIWDKPVVTNATLNLPGQQPMALNTTKLIEPVWSQENKPTFNPATIPNVIKGGSSGSITSTSPYYTEEWLQYNLPESKATMFTDRNWYYIDISPEIIGGTVIQVPYSSATGINNTSIDNLITFDINRSAEVYVHNNNNMNLNHFINDFGFENMNAPYAYRMMSYAADYTYQHVYFYRREYKVEPGETVTVTLPHATGANMYGVIVKFIDDYTFENNALTKSNGEAIGFPITRHTFIPTHKDPDKPDDAIWSNIKFYPRYSFDNMDGTSSKVPVLYVEDEYLGGNLLRYPYIINNSGIYSTAEFDVVSSCKIKFIWNDSATKPQLDTWAFVNDWTASTTTSMQLLSNNEPPYNCLIGGACYEKEFNVIPGESIHVSIPIYQSGRQFYVYSFPAELK